MQAASFEKSLFLKCSFSSPCLACHLFSFIDSLSTVIWSVVLRSAVITRQIIVQIKHFYPSKIIYPQPVSFIQKICLSFFFTICHHFLEYNGFLVWYPFRWHGHEWIPLTDLWNVCLFQSNRENSTPWGAKNIHPRTHLRENYMYDEQNITN